MTNTVLLIGNGFDLDLGLKTSYADFIVSAIFEAGRQKACETKHVEAGLNIVNRIYKVFRKRNCNWIDIEKELYNIATKNKNHYEYNDVDKATNNRCSDYIKESYDNLVSLLCEYFNNLDYSKIKKDSAAFRFINAVQYMDDVDVISFNYTNLDYLLNPDCKIKPLYIHGTAKSENIILGINESDNLKSGYGCMVKCYNKYYNSCNITGRLANADKVVIFGHSLGLTDYSYFKDFFNGLLDGKYNADVTIFTLNGVSKINLCDEIKCMVKRELFKLMDKNLHFVFTEDLKDDELKAVVDRLNCR